MLLKEMYQAMYGKIDTRIGRAFAPITEVDDEQMIKYKSKDGESKEMKASSAKTMPMDHPAKVEYDKLAGGETVERRNLLIFLISRPSRRKMQRVENMIQRQVRVWVPICLLYTSPSPRDRG